MDVKKENNIGTENLDTESTLLDISCTMLRTT